MQLIKFSVSSGTQVPTSHVYIENLQKKKLNCYIGNGNFIVFLYCEDSRSLEQQDAKYHFSHYIVYEVKWQAKLCKLNHGGFLHSVNTPPKMHRLGSKKTYWGSEVHVLYPKFIYAFMKSIEQHESVTEKRYKSHKVLHQFIFVFQFVNAI